jgi:murein DD-endopeptidase MepM/ murein hydrolase activator NlpD
MAGHPAAADRSRTLARLASDVRASPPVRVDPLGFREKGDKLYLPTAGWEGAVFRGTVVFLAERTARGWEWRGLLGAGASDPDALSELAQRSSSRRPAASSRRPAVRALRASGAAAASPRPSSIADLGIKSPWPRGRFFRAGGLYKFIQEQAAVAATPWPFNTAVLVSFTSRACGFGPNGYYYGQGPTHSSTRDRYAIDFTSNKQHVPYAEISTGTPVLAVTIGVVTDVREYVSGGSSVTDNHVYIDHYGEEELLAAVIAGMLTGTLPRSRYSARYLHLDGPNQVPVRDGMYVEQGTILGTMDDTGNSSGSHLHFSMHENEAGATGVRPTPMDGQSLTDGEDGKCMASTNDPRT